MSAREWKPGDVGMSNYGRVFYTTHADGAWIYDDGSGKEGITKSDPTGLRPLVVIDPEDAETVARIIDDYDARRGVSLGLGGRDRQNRVAQFQAALRSLITPPKPEEPTGLGAVVEDSDGKCWIRAAHIRHGWHRPMGTWATYADIAAVKILSEGVQ